MVLPASCPHSMVVTMGNYRHKVKVLNIPLSWGWSQMTGAKRRKKLCAPVICSHAQVGHTTSTHKYKVIPETCSQKIKAPAVPRLCGPYMKLQMTYVLDDVERNQIM